MGNNFDAANAPPLYSEEPAEEHRPYCVLIQCEEHGVIDAIPMGPTDMRTMEYAGRAAVMMEEALHGCEGRVTSSLRVGRGHSRLAIQDNTPSLDKPKLFHEPYYQA